MGPSAYSKCPLGHKSNSNSTCPKPNLWPLPQTWCSPKLPIWMKNPPNHPAAQGRSKDGNLEPFLSHIHLRKYFEICLPNIYPFLPLFYNTPPPTSTLFHFYLDGCNHLLVSRHPLWSPPISTSLPGVLAAILPLNYSYSTFRSQLKTTSSRQTPRDLS